VDFSRGLLQLLRSSVSLSHARQLTYAPRTPAPPRKQLSRTSALARVGYGGVYPGRGQMSSTSFDNGGPTATPHLICKCVTVRSLYVRIRANVKLLLYYHTDEVLCGYLSAARCRLFAYGPADATASRNPIISCLI